VTTSVESGRSEYAFKNEDAAAVDRHDLLSETLNEVTFPRLSSLGDLAGKRCLEVGAGAGSVARWMVDQVGPTGRVLATDLDPRYLRSDQGYEVLRHDLITEPVPEGPWDVIHARLVLVHIPQRVEILDRLVASLAPGGALVLEDFATKHGNLVLAAPEPRAVEVVEKFQAALRTHVLMPRGNDPDWAGKVFQAMLDAGLVDVSTEIFARSWAGGTAGTRMLKPNLDQARDGFLAAGMTPEDLDYLVELTEDPRLVIRGQLLYSTIGRKPEIVS
jgi:ubiquinone/menaquinone biosynthesis C-methylase UbiE